MQLRLSTIAFKKLKKFLRKNRRFRSNRSLMARNLQDQFNKRCKTSDFLKLIKDTKLKKFKDSNKALEKLG